jgi:hypothetical protein
MTSRGMLYIGKRTLYLYFISRHPSPVTRLVLAIYYCAIVICDVPLCIPTVKMYYVRFMHVLRSRVALVLYFNIEQITFEMRRPTGTLQKLQSRCSRSPDRWLTYRYSTTGLQQHSTIIYLHNNIILGL